MPTGVLELTRALVATDSVNPSLVDGGAGEAEAAAFVAAWARDVGLEVGEVGPEPVGVSYWADSAFLAAAGLPTVILGPTGAGAHASEEWVSVASCAALADRLVTIAETICG